MAAKAIAFVVVASAVVALAAQTRINPTDPQPTCNMCQGTYLPADEIQAYLKKAIPEEAERQLALADKMIRSAEDRKEPVDPSLHGKIDEAHVQAREMMRSKSQAQVP